MGLAIAVGPFVFFLAHLAWFFWYVRWPPRRPTGNAALVPSAGSGVMGVRFRYSAWPYYLFTAFVGSTALLVSAFGLAAASSGSVAGIVFAIVVWAAAVLLGWFLVTALRKAPGEVTISPLGVFHQSLTVFHFVPWYALTGVEAGRLGTPVITVKAYPSEDTVVGSFTGRFHPGELSYLPFMVIRTYWLGTDPGTVYQALAYYHANPDRRPELATPAALDRMAQGFGSRQV